MSADPAPSAHPPGPDAPHVVLVRPTALDADSRGKKVALSLSRMGLRVTVLAVSPDSATHRGRLGPVEVELVPVSFVVRDGARARLERRRARRYPVLGWRTPERYLARRDVVRAELRSLSAQAAARRASTRGGRPGSLLWAALFRTRILPKRLYLRAMRPRQLGQQRLDVATRGGWRWWNRVSRSHTVALSPEGTLVELLDYELAFGSRLDRLQPDVVHAHDPRALGVAARSVARARALGRDVKLVYDAREDFSGLPVAERGSRRHHAALVEHEERYARRADAMLTVSEPIAAALPGRLRVARPTVVLNAPVARPLTRPQQTVREAAGVDSGTPLLVYSGTISAARGVEVLVEALSLLEGVHLVMVTVPYPHPSVPALLARAAELGVADRLHVVPPVGTEAILGYLSGADAGVHTMPGGSPNHDMALPNKLFEYVHAGLPLVVTDARLMATFVREHGLGEVFRSGDAADLARAALAVLADPGAYRDPSRRAAVVSAQSWQAQESNLWTVYAALLGRPMPTEVGEFPAVDLVLRDDE